ncbi:MAG: NADP-dependent malic enzyme [Bradymonadales bacterium]|nr:NADP-dependent malic enzyme [Bradymonadales bacterium]
MTTKEELLKKAEKPGQDALRLHPFYRGKIEVIPKCRIRDNQDFAIWYTPGVAAPCRDIQKNPERVFEHTNKWNTIAVVSDGTRVLGLGDIGPEAALPVMEGKALLFKYLGGVDAYPLCLDTKDPDEIVRIVLALQPSLGGVNLEDISQPKCFDILDNLRSQARIPIWHDDQQGTATVTVAGLINALKIVDKKIDQVKVAMMGAGAAGICVMNLLLKVGVDPAKVVICDINGLLNTKRDDLKNDYPQAWELAQKTNKEGLDGYIDTAMKGADVLIAYSKPGPDTIKKEWISTMADDAIVFVCANPIPEIWPWEAKEAGARIVATGRSDFPNQVNNSLGFPGIFRGTLDVMARTITDGMCIAAAYELAKVACDKGLDEDRLIPTMDDWEVFPREAVAVGVQAMKEGVARRTASAEVLYQEAETIIKRSRDQVQHLQEAGFIEMVE